MSESHSLAGKTILIIGLGLIGGSIAKGLREANPDQIILAADDNAESLKQAIESKTISQAGSMQTMAKLADVIVIGLPPLKLPETILSLEKVAREGAVVTDVASVKSHIATTLANTNPSFREYFVPGHPIAGSEKSGFGAATGSLFKGRRVILTPDSKTNCSAVAIVNSLWRTLGAQVMGMSLAKHDEVLAATSHLPHALAFAIVDVLSQNKGSDDIFRYAAGGFADFSRLASSNPVMWSDIFVANSEATEKVLGDYIDNLTALRELIKNKDRTALFALFEHSKLARDRFIAQHFTKEKTTIMNNKSITFKLQPGGGVSGTLRVPGDKSISHRSIIFGSIANGITHVSGFLEGEDALNTVAAFRAMGVTITGPEDGKLIIYGVGKDGLQQPTESLYMGNSGTAMRLLAGLLAAQRFDSVLTGDESLSGRPMNRVVKPLQSMGANIQAQESGSPPLAISGSALHGISYKMPMASAQVKSCLLLAGLYGEGDTEITEPAACRDHTERMLSGFGYPVTVDGPITRVTGKGELTATDIDVPADISSAAFFLVAAAITPGSKLVLEHVGVNPTRIGVINILKLMGAKLELCDERIVGGEPVADISIEYSPLQGIEIPQSDIPLAIDEFPVLFIAAANAQGDTVLRGAEELRVKESDRIEAMATGLSTLGVVNEVYPDGIKITGSSTGGGVIDSHGDHRIAMAFSIAALQATAPITVLNCNNVATSFPGFVESAAGLGLQIEAES
ncbi:MAG: bifunctional prephenate dehydrogenase/3-phosphoshikimate 1-carboxyvinyltransferase [Pseudohongiellaceae bacterium]